MIRMRLAGYIMRPRSQRRRCADIHPDLVYRWFYRLDLTAPVPDHPKFPRNRHRRFHDSVVLRHLV